MSTRTVDKHLEHVCITIGVESRAGAVAAAAQIIRDKLRPDARLTTGNHISRSA